MADHILTAGSLPMLPQRVAARTTVARRRSGFYHSALSAGVPLGMACIDYGAKEVRLVSYANLSGNINADRVRSEDVSSRTPIGSAAA